MDLENKKDDQNFVEVIKKYTESKKKKKKT